MGRYLGGYLRGSFYAWNDEKVQAGRQAGQAGYVMIGIRIWNFDNGMNWNGWIGWVLEKFGIRALGEIGS